METRLGVQNPKRNACGEPFASITRKGWENLVRVASLVLLSGTLIVLMALYAYYLDRPVTTDDGGFLNPVLEYLHTGRVTYPAHGFPHSMSVHPPVHYWLAGVLMKSGLSFYPAVETLPFVFGVIALITIMASPLTDLLKLSFLIGMFLPNFALLFLDLRPEVEIALGLIAGLMLLQTGRLTGWRNSCLFLGSFILAFSSGLHYFALSAIAGCAVYAAYAVYDLGWQASLPKVAWIVAGASLFLVPYLLLFFFPEYSDIRDRMGAYGPPPGALFGKTELVKALNDHREIYSSAYGSLTQFVPALYATFSWPLKPIFLARIPAVLVSTPIMFLFRPMRSFVIASLPFQLSLLFLAHHKQIIYARFELALLYASEAALVLFFLQWTIRRMLPDLCAWVTPLCAVLISGVFIAGSPAWHLRSDGGFVDDLALARAAGKQILGDNAIVAGRSICLWYTSGGKYYRNVTADLIYPTDISTINPNSYFSDFNGVAEDSNGSWTTYNKQKMALASWYLNGTLSLEGFYAGRPLGEQDGYSYFLTGLQPKGPVQAWFWRRHHLFHFVEDPGGESSLLALVSPHGEAWKAVGNDGFYLAAFGLPPDRTDYLTFHVVPHMSEPEVQSKLPKHSSIRDVIRGRVDAVDVSAMLHTVDYHREMAQVYFNRNELLAATATPDPSVESVTIPMRNVNPRSKLDESDSADRSVRVTMPDAQSEPVLYSYPVDLEGRGAYVVSAGLRIRSGNLVLSVTDPEGRSVSSQLFRNHSQPITEERVLVDANKFPRIMVMIWTNNPAPGKADFEVKNLSARKVLPQRSQE